MDFKQKKIVFKQLGTNKSLLMLNILFDAPKTAKELMTLMKPTSAVGVQLVINILMRHKLIIAVAEPNPPYRSVNRYSIAPKYAEFIKYVLNY